MIEDENLDYTISQVEKISEAMNEDKIVTTLNETSILIKTLPFKDEFKEIEKEIDEILNKSEILRKLRLNQTIKNETETRIEYYDEDIGEDKRTKYDKETENMILKLQKKIRIIMGKIIQETSGEIDL